MQATHEVVRAVGVERVAMNDVATRAGVSKGTLYHYYARIDALLAAWEEWHFVQLSLRFAERLQAVVVAPPPPEESVSDLVGLGFDLAYEHFGHFHDRDNAEFMSRVVGRIKIGRDVIHAIGSIFASGPHAARWRDRNRAVSARIVVTTVVFGAYDAYCTAGSPDEVAELRRHHQSMAVNYLLTDS